MITIPFTTEMDGRCRRYMVQRDHALLSYAEILELWQHDEVFCSLWIDLRQSTFYAFRWETPPLTATTTDRPFECVLLDSPALSRKSDNRAFEQHLSDDGPDVVAFENLGGDTLMVVPACRGPEAAYGHLAAFVRDAPPRQVHHLWQTAGQAVERRLSDAPLWLSTAGGGVAWLHVRLDSRPKYYGYAPLSGGPLTWKERRGTGLLLGH